MTTREQTIICDFLEQYDADAKLLELQISQLDPKLDKNKVDSLYLQLHTINTKYNTIFIILHKLHYKISYDENNRISLIESKLK